MSNTINPHTFPIFVIVISIMFLYVLWHKLFRSKKHSKISKSQINAENIKRHWIPYGSKFEYKFTPIYLLYTLYSPDSAFFKKAIEDGCIGCFVQRKDGKMHFELYSLKHDYFVYNDNSIVAYFIEGFDFSMGDYQLAISGFNDCEKVMPEKYGKYFVLTGGIPLNENINISRLTFNGIGWSSNHYSIKYWAEINPFKS